MLYKISFYIPKLNSHNTPLCGTLYPKGLHYINTTVERRKRANDDGAFFLYLSLVCFALLCAGKCALIGKIMFAKIGNRRKYIL